MKKNPPKEFTFISKILCLTFFLFAILLIQNCKSSNYSLILAINPRANLVTTSSSTCNFRSQILSDKNDIHPTAYQRELYSESSPDKTICDSAKVISNQSQGVKPE